MKKINFTLIEMVVVCAILLFLSAGLFALGNVLFKKYYILQGKMEMLKIQNGITAYKSATGNYPPDYVSSSYNEDGSGASLGGWAPVYMNVSMWDGYKEAKDVYDKTTARPKALVQYIAWGWPHWGVWVWGWGDDIGGLVPALTSDSKPYGFVCQAPKCGNELCVIGDFPPPFPSMTQIDPQTQKPVVTQIVFVKIEESDVTGVYKCKYGAKGSLFNAFKCGSDPSKDNYSCGWHSFISEDWEGGYNIEETSKALYDFLARPMKGRMKDGKPTNPKYDNCKPFIELSNKLVRPASRPPPINSCNGAPIKDEPATYKKYGDGIYGLNDSYEIVDVWGNRYLYLSSAPEYIVPNFSNSLKPYQSFSAEDSALINTDSLDLDIHPPFYNPATYDLGSKGPDGKAVNWIPMDFRLKSPSGYSEEDIKNVSSTNNNAVDSSVERNFIFGQKDGTGMDQQFFKLPSESLKLLDYDNDNLTNFFENNN